jgi:ATP-dependent DNA ligase
VPIGVGTPRRLTGKVDHGFDSASAKDLQARLKPLILETQPYAKKIAHRGIWVEPSLLAEIEYRAKSVEGKVRHPQGHPGGFMSWPVALMWGTVIVAVVIAVLAAAYLLI